MNLLKNIKAHMVKTRLKVNDVSENNQPLRERFVVVREEPSNMFFQMLNPFRGDLGFSYVFNEDEAVRKAKALARFYKEPTDSGVENGMAWQMTQKVFLLPDDIITECFLKSLEVAKDVAIALAGEKKESSVS